MQTDKEALIEITKGTSFALLILGVFVLFIWGLNGIFRPSEIKPEDRFKVVDQYGPCEVVRYTPKYGDDFAYFLDCK